jgi:molybdopterin converting factor small subunit
MLISILAGVALLLVLYFAAVRAVASRIKLNFEIDELVDFDRELRGQYIDHITKMAILGMFSQNMVTIHGFSGNINQATERVFSGENFSFKRIRKIRNQR